jgi:hypothetical protein
MGAVEMLKKLFLGRFVFRDLRATQAAGGREKLGLLLQNFLQERNRVTKIAQFNGAERP